MYCIVLRLNAIQILFLIVMFVYLFFILASVQPLQFLPLIGCKLFDNFIARSTCSYMLYLNDYEFDKIMKQEMYFIIIKYNNEIIIMNIMKPKIIMKLT